MSTSRILKKAFVFISVILLLSGCGTIAAANETWTVVKLLTKGEDVETSIDPVEVRNCFGFPERKITECSGGTENNVSFTLGGSLGKEISIYNFTSTVSFDPNVSLEFGFSRTSGESLTLDTPPDGSVYQYLISTTYKIIAGEALVRSSSGKEDTVKYRYQASCSLRIEGPPQIISCQDASSGTSLTPSALQTATPIVSVPDTPVPTIGNIAIPTTFSSDDIASCTNEIAYLHFIDPGQGNPFEGTVFLIDSDGYNREPILTSNKYFGFRSISWSPDGNKIALINADDKVSVLNLNNNQLIDIADYAADPAWSHKHNLIAVVSIGWLDPNSSIYLGIDVMNSDGTNRKNIFQCGEGCSLGGITWSPDDGQIAFWMSLEEDVNNTYKDVYNIYKFDLGNEILTQLTFSSEASLFHPDGPTWSPDGTQIAFASKSLYIIGADGSKMRKLNIPTLSSIEDPDWSPDGKQLVFVITTGIFVINTDGSGFKQLVEHTLGTEYSPKWRPCNSGS